MNSGIAAFENMAPTSFATYGSGLDQSYSSWEEAFPTVDPGREPLGVNILVQIRQPKMFSKGGLQLVTDTRASEYYNTRVAKVVAVGPLCFRSSMESQDADGNPTLVHVDWPEGKWFKVGDYVEVPQYGGQRFVVTGKVPHVVPDAETRKMVTVEDDEEITFAFFKAKEIIAKITCDPRTIKAYAD